MMRYLSKLRQCWEVKRHLRLSDLLNPPLHPCDQDTSSEPAQGSSHHDMASMRQESPCPELSTSQSREKAFRLLQLPKELRQKILQYALVSNGSMITDPANWRLSTFAGQQPALLKVCKLLREDGLQIFYGCNNWMVETQCAYFARWVFQIGEVKARLLRNVYYWIRYKVCLDATLSSLRLSLCWLDRDEHSIMCPLPDNSKVKIHIKLLPKEPFGFKEWNQAEWTIIPEARELLRDKIRSVESAELAKSGGKMENVKEWLHKTSIAKRLEWS